MAKPRGGLFVYEDNMPGGRPMKYKTEKALCDYIELNIELFCRDVLNARYTSHQRESFIVPKQFGANKPRVDFDIQTDNGRVLVEVKNPSQAYSETTRAIGQLLSYGVLAEPNEVKLVLVASKIVPETQQLIMKYELPITVVYLNDVLAVWDNDFQKRLNAGNLQVGENAYAVS